MSAHAVLTNRLSDLGRAPEGSWIETAAAAKLLDEALLAAGQLEPFFVEPLAPRLDNACSAVAARWLALSTALEADRKVDLALSAACRAVKASPVAEEVRARLARRLADELVRKAEALDDPGGLIRQELYDEAFRLDGSHPEARERFLAHPKAGAPAMIATLGLDDSGRVRFVVTDASGRSIPCAGTATLEVGGRTYDFAIDATDFRAREVVVGGKTYGCEYSYVFDVSPSAPCTLALELTLERGGLLRATRALSGR